VQFWHPEWQQLIFGSPSSYLERIMEQGFDGIYLDRADAFLNRESERPTARDDMKAFLTGMAEHARRRNPHFLIVMQNAEELIENDEVLSAIDAIAKEDLLYGADQPGERNKTADVRWSLKLLRTAQRAERRVLVVEYLRDPAKMATAYKRIVEEGFLPYFGPRMLSCLNPPAVLTEARRLPEHPCR
jgi:cysteinyl-tRNA synthetase